MVFFLGTTLQGHDPGPPATHPHALPPMAPVLHVVPVGQVEWNTNTFGVRLRIFEPYQKALVGLTNFSHIYVLWWFDRNDDAVSRSRLMVHPMGNTNNPLTGVFATRSPRRPNPVALTVCEIERVEPPFVYVKSIDAWNDTPIIDIKPVTTREVGFSVRTPAWQPPPDAR